MKRRWQKNQRQEWFVNLLSLETLPEVMGLGEVFHRAHMLAPKLV